ncbi:MAG: hypothetical protein D6689_08755 [Deltaproteobacteria bacterium]|nr:MAG: hypothetical protein D6689_08755 [Deltaproteobacteria bacterium]
MPAPSVLHVLRANLQRAVIISLVVGTALLLINHGDHLALEPICPHFYAKAVCTYVVPFGVSMVSALFAARDR